MILANGCSFTRYKTSWVYQLGIPQYEIINLAQSGAGNGYICDTTISELSANTYDYVLVMWSGIARYDLQITGESIKAIDTNYSSLAQSKINDWPNKAIEPVNDQDLVQKNWLFGSGQLNNDPNILSSKIFEPIYRNCDLENFTQYSLIKMISLQSYLKARNIPYIFCFYMDYLYDLQQLPNLFQQLDFDHIETKDNIYSIAKRNDWFESDGLHPNKLANQEWGKIVRERL